MKQPPRPMEATMTPTDPDIDDVFIDTDPTRRVRGALAPVIFFAGSKGGVGTTSLMLTAAELACVGGQVERVVAIDADPLRGHVAKYLRAPTSGPNALPTLTTGRLANDPQKSLVRAGRINAAHAKSVPDVSMAAVLAPAPGHYDPDDVSPGLYQRTVESLRQHVDLILIDAGVLNVHYPTDLHQAFLYPGLRAGAWLVQVTNTSLPAVGQAVQNSHALTTEGVRSKDSVFSLVNMKRATLSAEKLKQIRAALGKTSTTLDPIGYHEKEIGDQVDAGHLPTTHPQVVKALAEVLDVVTGRPAFSALSEGLISTGDRPVARATRKLLPSRGRK